MPKILKLGLMTPGHIASLRGKWQAAKTEHDAALKAKKITFNKNLGSKLEKRVALHRDVKAFKKGDSVLLIKGKLNTLKANGKDIVTTAKAYQAKIAGLGNPAEKELKEALDTLIEDAGEFDIAFVETKLKKK